MCVVARASVSDPESNPIFLVGSERSGTTLLRLMLDHHPDIAFNLESEFLVTHISDSGEFPDVGAYRRALRESRVFRHSHFTLDESLGFASLVNDFLRQKRQRDGKRIVGGTVHYQFGKLRYVWPNAKYIYLLRDARDVAKSVVGMGWAGNEYVAADWWLTAESEWASVRSTLPASRWMEMRFEDLTADPVAQLRRVCDFIGVAYSERMFDYAKTSSYPLPDPSQNFKWRETMQPRALRLIEARIGAHLAERGYALSSAPRLHVGRVRDKWLRVQSRAGSMRHRVGVYGLGLVTADFFGRRMGWSSLQGTARRAMDVIDDRNLR